MNINKKWIVLYLSHPSIVSCGMTHEWSGAQPDLGAFVHLKMWLPVEVQCHKPRRQGYCEASPFCITQFHQDCSISTEIQCMGRWQLKTHWNLVHIVDLEWIGTILSLSYHKVMKLDDFQGLFLYAGWWVASLPVLIPSKGRFEFGIFCKLFCFLWQH